MRRSVVITGAVFALSLVSLSAVSAADVPAQAPVYKATASVPYKWDGKYVGVYVGVEQGKSNTNVDGWTDKTCVLKDHKKPQYEIVSLDSVWENPKWSYDPCKKNGYTLTNYPGVASDGNVIGLTLGAYLGYNKQVNQVMVLGVEVDAGYSGARDNEVIYAVTSSHKMPWNARLRGRVGFLPTAAQDTMLYLALGGVLKEQRTSITGPSETASENKVKAGLTAAVGVEHKWGALTARVEGGYDRVSDQTVCITGACTTLKGGSMFARAGLGVNF